MAVTESGAAEETPSLPLGGPAHDSPVTPAFPTDEEIEKYVNFGPDRFVQRLWDHIHVQEDGITRQQLKEEILFATGVPIVWFKARHPEFNGVEVSKFSNRAENEYLNTTVDNAIAQGWMEERDGRLYTTDHGIPDHLPLETIGGESGALKVILSSYEPAVLQELRKQNSVLRRPRDPKLRKQLRTSLEKFGQVNPILTWTYRGDTVTVDGVTRSEILADLGVEPWTEAVPTAESATEIMLKRIAVEMVPTTKDQSPERLAQYIETLQQKGFNIDTIVDLVGRSRKRLYQLGVKSPKFTDADAAQILELHAQGLSVQEVTDRVQWSKSQVYNVLAEERNRLRASQQPVAPAPKPATTKPATTKKGTPRVSSSKVRVQKNAQVDAIAARYGVSPTTIGKTSPQKTALGMEHRPSEVLQNYPAAFKAILAVALQDSTWVEYIREQLGL